MMNSEMNPVALSGQIFVCIHCGKRSRDLFGKQKIDKGWDISCIMNAVQCYEDGLKFDEDGRVKEAVQVDSVEVMGAGRVPSLPG